MNSSYNDRLQMSSIQFRTHLQQELVNNPFLEALTDTTLPNSVHSGAIKLDSDSKRNTTDYVQPTPTDFILSNNNGLLSVGLSLDLEIRIHPEFQNVRNNASKRQVDPITKEKNRHVKEQVSAAMSLINTVAVRRRLLLKTMNAILAYQHEYFTTGDPGKLRPMVLDDIATLVNLSISLISRAISGKSIQTAFGLYPLKYFFSTGPGRDRSQRVGTYQVKAILKELITNESKQMPLTDLQLQQLLAIRGYLIARRTITKYREEDNIPMTWQRRQL